MYIINISNQLKSNKMKKILALSMFLGLLVFGTSTLKAQKKQSKKQATSTQNVENQKNESDARKNNDQSKTHKSTGYNKDGSLDMRLKANKRAKQNATVPSSPVSTSNNSSRASAPRSTTSATQSQKPVNNTSENGDKVIGT